MARLKFLCSYAFILLIFSVYANAQEDCLNCHQNITPNIVSEWKVSLHGKKKISCSVCHSDKHNSEKNADKAIIPTPEVCSSCHPKQFGQYRKGKHSLAWAAMKAMPTMHWQPMEMIEGMKGCGGCHKIGLKTEQDIEELKKSGTVFGVASCDSCHTRHLFSVKEASQPQACQTCHMGFDHPQWEMYSASKHGVRYALSQANVISAATAVATCQTCHMQDKDHNVRTSWGFLAVRLPMPEDKNWADNRKTILKALGVFGLEGKPTPRFDVIKAADVCRITQEDWQYERDKMIKTCSHCHSENFARAELEKGDKIIKETDLLMAEAIQIISDLYKDGILEKPQNYSYAFADLLMFHDAPTTIEQKLFLMFFEHRMRTFQGIFHANPDYALWYGWSQMKQSLAEIKEKAWELRSRR